MANRKGTLCLTFDDLYLNSWKKALPFFAEYQAHVTFFIWGTVDSTVISDLKKLQDAGHSIGLHSINHTRAADYQKEHGKGAYTRDEILSQLDSCRKNNIQIRSFAYPFSQRTEETDQELFKYFDFLRTNCSLVKAAGVPLSKADGCFVKQVGKKQLFYGFPSSGDFNIDEVKAAMKRASEENAVLVFYAHNIVENPQRNNITYSQLKQILDYAKTLGMSICGMNEL